jgi:hypothetical protein
MNNYNLATADRLTHIKIVAVSVIAGIVVVAIGKAARPELPDMGMAVRSPVQTVDKPIVWTSADRVTIR